MNNSTTYIIRIIMFRILNYFHLRLMMKHWVAVVVYTTVKLMVVSSRDMGWVGSAVLSSDRGLGGDVGEVAVGEGVASDHAVPCNHCHPR